MKTTKTQKSLLQKVLVQQKLDVVNNVHLIFACASIIQDVSDDLKDILKPKMHARKVTKDYSDYLGQVMRNMQRIY